MDKTSKILAMAGKYNISATVDLASAFGRLNLKKLRRACQKSGQMTTEELDLIKQCISLSYGNKPIEMTPQRAENFLRASLKKVREHYDWVFGIKTGDVRKSSKEYIIAKSFFKDVYQATEEIFYITKRYIDEDGNVQSELNKLYNR